MARQGRYWLLTIPADDWTPPGDLGADFSYLRGQLELGAGGFRHWQVLAAFKTNKRLASVKAAFTNTTHAELSRSDAATDYVWKDDTAVEGTRFQLGTRPLKRNNRADWDAIWSAAAARRIMDIPSDIRLRCYNQIRRVGVDHLAPTRVDRHVSVFWGVTGSGKSHRAWAAGGDTAYSKDPRTKWWDGYRGQEHVIIDEFRGVVDISHILRWTDKYPVCVETKGASVELAAKFFYFTSNLDPRHWYPDLDNSTLAALMRRITVEEHLTEPYVIENEL